MKYSDLTQIVIGCAMKVHSKLGNGFQEVIYQRGMVIEFNRAKVSFSREHDMPIYYDQHHIGTRRVDFLVEGIISVELKALLLLEPAHYAQARNYLEAYDLEVGLLLNFGAKSLQYKRFENSKYKPSQGPTLSEFQNPHHPLIPPSPRSD